MLHYYKTGVFWISTQVTHGVSAFSEAHSQCDYKGAGMKRLLFVLLMMTCSVSWAEWELADWTDEFFVYLDKSSIRKNRNIVKMWIMKEYPSVQTNPFARRYQSEKSYHVFDCQAETLAIMTIIQYSGSMGSGSVVFSGNRTERELEWRPIVPQSGGQLQWQIACGRK